METVNRRQFLGQTGVASLSALQYTHAADAPLEKVNVAVMGLRGRGKLLASHFAGLKDAQVVALCDVDESLFPAVVKTVAEKQGREPKLVQDVRKLLGDKSIHAIVIAAPNHWHALAAVWACQAGHDVYVEKPVSHNIVEGRRMVEAARKYERIVQSGTQRRGSKHWLAAAEYLKSGKIGHIGMARAWINRKRPNIGHPKDEAVPKGVDYDLWQGPAPAHAFNPNRFHYNWHWFWDYGGGELANNGVHMLDMARLGLGVDAPTRITSTGGKFSYDDDQQTPDTQLVTYEFPGTILLWEHRCWSNFGLLNEEGPVRIGGGLIYYGDKGTLTINDKGWQAYVDGKVVDKQDGEEDSLGVITSFVESVKTRKMPNADIEEGHRSTTLCHLGNVSHRVGRPVQWDGKLERFIKDDEANRYLSREYRKPFVLPEKV